MGRHQFVARVGQVFQLERQVIRKKTGEERDEVVYGLSRLGAERATSSSRRDLEESRAVALAEDRWLWQTFFVACMHWSVVCAWIMPEREMRRRYRRWERRPGSLKEAFVRFLRRDAWAYEDF